MFDALARQILVTPAGSADTEHDRVQVRVDGRLGNVRDVSNVTLEVGGQLLKLADIATVRAGYEDPPSFSIRHNGVPVLAIGVTMQSNGNVLDFGKALEQRLAQMEMRLDVTDAALAEIAKAGFDPVYGARPLKRAMKVEILSAWIESWRDGIRQAIGDLCRFLFCK